MAVRTVPAPIALPQNLDEHPVLQRAERRRREFEEKLAAARAEQIRLVAERARVQREKHLSGVGALAVGREPELNSFGSTIADLDRTIAEFADREAMLDEALRQHVVIADGLRMQVSEEMAEQIAAAARNLMTEMAQHIDKFEQLSIEMERLRACGLGLLPQRSQLIMGLVPAWREEAGAFGAICGRAE